MEGEDPSKSKRRAARACDACRGRKIRCLGVDQDQTKCKRCLKLDLDCTYLMPVKRPLPTSQVEELQARIKDLEARLARRGTQNGSRLFHEDPARSPTNGDDGSDDDDDDDDQDNCSDSLSVGTSSSHHDSGQIAFIPSYIHTSDRDRSAAAGSQIGGHEDDLSTSRSTGLLAEKRTLKGSYAFIGSTSLLYPLADARQLPRKIETIALQMAEDVRTRVRLEYWQWDASAVRAELERSPHAFWPSNEDAKRLFDAFFDANGAAGHTMGIDPVVLRKDHEVGLTGGLSPPRLARIYAVCALGAWHCQLGLEQVNNRGFLTGIHWWLASRKIILGSENCYDHLTDSIEKAQTYSLQATFAATRPTAIQKAWHLAGDSLRTLVDCGLHRKALTHQRTKDGDLRKKTFWSAVIIEKVITSAAGRCSLLTSEWHDAEPPKEEEDLALWCEVETMMLTEKIQRAKFSYGRKARWTPSVKRLQQIEAKLDFLDARLEHYRGQDHLRWVVPCLQMMVDSVRFLYVTPDVLNHATIPAVALDTIECVLRRTLVTAAALNVAHITPLTSSAALRIFILSHYLSRPSETEAVRKRFAPYTAQGLRWLRTLEGRFMTAGKVGDLLVLPVLKEEEEDGGSGPSGDKIQRESADDVSVGRKRQASGSATRRRSTAQHDGPSKTGGSSSKRASISGPICNKPDRNYDTMYTESQIPPIWSSSPQPSVGYSQTAHAPISFSRTGSDAETISSTVEKPSRSTTSTTTTTGTTSRSAGNLTPSSRPFLTPSMASFATSENQSGNELDLLTTSVGWPSSPKVVDAGGQNGGESSTDSTGQEFGGLDLSSMDAQELARFLFDYNFS